jgi:hypothetical protein
VGRSGVGALDEERAAQSVATYCTPPNAGPRKTTESQPGEIDRPLATAATAALVPGKGRTHRQSLDPTQRRVNGRVDV